jgi:hypothetical protein
VKVDDGLKTRPELSKPLPAGGTAPKLSDAELVTMAVMQSLLKHPLGTALAALPR